MNTYSSDNDNYNMNIIELEVNTNSRYYGLLGTCTRSMLMPSIHTQKPASSVDEVGFII